MCVALAFFTLMHPSKMRICLRRTSGLPNPYPVNRTYLDDQYIYIYIYIYTHNCVSLSVLERRTGGAVGGWPEMGGQD